jgi:hypothetical protein
MRQELLEQRLGPEQTARVSRPFDPAKRHGPRDLTNVVDRYPDGREHLVPSQIVHDVPARAFIGRDDIVGTK